MAGWEKGQTQKYDIAKRYTVKRCKKIYIHNMCFQFFVDSAFQSRPSQPPQQDIVASPGDYGVMIFADQRYARSDKRSKIPDWSLGKKQRPNFVSMPWIQLRFTCLQVPRWGSGISWSQGMSSWLRTLPWKQPETFCCRCLNPTRLRCKHRGMATVNWCKLPSLLMCWQLHDIVCMWCSHC